MGPWIIELGKVGAKALATSGGAALGKKGVEKLFPPKKDPFIGELGKKVVTVVATAAATAATALAVDTVKKQRARRNSTSDSNGPKKEH